MMARCVYGRCHSDFNSDNSSSILIKYLFSMPSSSELCVCVRLPLDVLDAAIPIFMFSVRHHCAGFGSCCGPVLCEPQSLRSQHGNGNETESSSLFTFNLNVCVCREDLSSYACACGYFHCQHSIQSYHRHALNLYTFHS